MSLPSFKQKIHISSGRVQAPSGPVKLCVLLALPALPQPVLLLPTVFSPHCSVCPCSTRGLFLPVPVLCHLHLSLLQVFAWLVLLVIPTSAQCPLTRETPLGLHPPQLFSNTSLCLRCTILSAASATVLVFCLLFSLFPSLQCDA